MRWMENTYPDKARGWVGFNVPMSHKITAACDVLLMPSRFEPCGLNQLYAMAYGTVPVAHSTGGLRDTVIPFNPWDGALESSPFSWLPGLMEALRVHHKAPAQICCCYPRLLADARYGSITSESVMCLKLP